MLLSRCTHPPPLLHRPPLPLRLFRRIAKPPTLTGALPPYPLNSPPQYWEDKSDEFREGEGSLLPLWRFSSDRSKRKQVTAVSWHPAFPDLFAVGFGSYDFMQQGSGLIYCYSLKNTSHPEFTFSTETGVMSLDFHPQHHALLCVGCYDGTVMVFDVRKKQNKPIYQSTIKTGKHTDPVWQVRSGSAACLRSARGVPPHLVTPRPNRSSGRRRTWPRSSTSSPSPPTAASPTG